MAPAAALGPEIYARGFRFSPTPQEAVAYYLPRLVSGDPLALHEAVRPVIHRADVYASDPADLARRFRPLPRTHNRFFFTAVRKGARAAGSGSWAGQSTAEIKGQDGGRIGELRKFRYKKHGGVLTDWLMEECSASAAASCGGGGGGVQFALCKVYVSPKAAMDSDAYKESAAAFVSAPPPPPPAAAPAAVVAQPAAVKRPMPPQDAMPPPWAKRMRGPDRAVQPSPPPQPPAPILSCHTAVRKMPFALPQPYAPRRGWTTPSATQPSPASALPPPPPPPTAPTTRPHLAPPVRKMPFAPPQPYAPRRGLTTPSATQPSPASALPPPPPPPAPTTRPHLVAPPVRKMSFTPPQPCPHPPRRSLMTSSASATQPSLASAPPPAPAGPSSRPALHPRGSPMPLPTPPRPPEQQVPLPATTSVASARHMPQQAPPAPPCQPQVFVQVQPKPRRTILDPFEAEEEQTDQMVAAAPPAMAKLQDDDDDFAKELDDMLSDEEEEQTVAAAPAKLQDDDDDDDFAKELDDMLSADAEEQMVAAAWTKLQDDDEFAKVLDDIEAEEPTVEFDVDAFFDFSEEDLDASI